MSQIKQNLAAFMADANLTDRVKIECFLLVALDIRKAGLIMVPAELPGLETVGQEIDNEFYWRTTGRRDPSKGVTEFLSTKVRDTVRKFGKNSLQYKMEVLREIFDRVVLTTPQYRSHLDWATRLGLSYSQEEVRPSIREIWIYKDRDAGAEIARLARLRRDLRHQALSKPRPNAPAYYRVFPEESSTEFVKSLGELLGYPPSCLTKYMADRASQDISVEMRAAHQVSEYKLAGKIPPKEAFFVKDFFPCNPDCPEACEVGVKAIERLEELDGGVADRYRQILAQNADMVERYPEIIRAHAEGLTKRMAAFQEEAKKTGE